MKRTEKAKDVKLYILEKINSGEADIVAKAVEAYSLSAKTVHKYINDLLVEGKIVRKKRGEYLPVEASKVFVFSRKKGELTSEDTITTQHILPQMGEMSAQAGKIWSYGLSEMINNVIDHSEAEELRVEVKENGWLLSVTIRDNGVGIFTKVQKYFGLASPEEAVKELFKGKLTTDSSHHSGEGIFFTSRMLDSFCIVSDGCVFSHQKFAADQIEKLASPGGTVVYMSLSRYSRREIRDVFDAFADVDGGFTRTNIKIKNYFDTDPVSRSQAKRLCQHLENFREVELDFTDVEWMGQGFAHQLFVVFAREHEGVEIKAVNMTDDVRKMYQHVKSR